jgi:hypothetical protein
MFVTVLASCSRTGKPFDSEIASPPRRKGGQHRNIRIHDSNGHGARVDTAAPFGGRDTLNAVSADFIFERFETLAFDFEGDLAYARVRWAFPYDAGLSTLAGEQAKIGVREIADEQLRIGAAFSGADFQNPFHDTFLCCRPKMGDFSILAHIWATAI